MTVTASGNKKKTAKVSGPSSDTQAQSGIEKGYSQLSKTVGTYLRKDDGRRRQFASLRSKQRKQNAPTHSLGNYTRNAVETGGGTG